MLPYLDGERTPDLPLAAGTFLGLRHDTSPEQILRAAYEGAVAGLLGGLDTMRDTGAEVAADAPIVLLGGGARGSTWRKVIGQASGRALLLPKAEELVALGAAVQAATVLTGDDADEVARRWDTTAGEVIAPLDHDPGIVARVQRSRRAVEPALQAGL